MTTADLIEHDHTLARTVRASTIRAANLFGIVGLAIFNVADVMTTNRLLAHGGTETNPLSSALLTNNDLLVVKLMIIGLLGLGVVLSRPRVGVMAATWFAAGIYAASVISNLLLLKVV